MLMANPCKPLVSSKALYSCSLIQGGRRLRGRSVLLVGELAVANAFEDVLSRAFEPVGSEFVVLSARAGELVEFSAGLVRSGSKRGGRSPGGWSGGGGPWRGGSTMVRELVSPS